MAVAIALSLLLLGSAWPLLRWAPAPIAPRGGEPADLLLPVPRYRQDDPAWARETIGGSQEAMAEVGCALASAAMVVSFLDRPLTPAQLNRTLKDSGGYTARGWLRWQAVADATQGRLRLTWAGGVAHALIDGCLRSGVPAIVRVPPSPRSPAGATGHWVVIVGKRGLDYLVHDPQRAQDGPAVLADLADEIRALRVYRAAPPGGWR